MTAPLERIEADVVVVGAGLAGLTTAREVVAAGHSAVVVEARDRVGGRLRNHTFDDGTIVDVGGQWIGPTQRRMVALVADLALGTIPTHRDGQNLLRLGTTTTRYRGAIPRISPVALLDLGRARSRFDRLARTIPLDAPWTAERALSFDAQTFHSWIRRNARTTKARELLAVYAEAVLAAEPHDFSLLHALFNTHAGGGVDVMAGTRGGAQQDRIVGGAHRIAEVLAERLGDRVRLGRPVQRIEHRDGVVHVSAAGLVVSARRAVVAVPPALASRITYDPVLPAARDQLTQRLPAGSVIKYNVAYATPFWRDEGLSGHAVGDRGPVKLTFDSSPPSGRPGVLVAFVAGTHARRLSSHTAEERRRAVLDSLCQYFGEGARDPVDYVELDWSAEEWTRGCYGAHFPTGVWTQYGPALREPVGPLHWAGTETASEWNGYMEGAVQSGQRAAAEVLDHLAATAEARSGAR